MRRSAQRLLSRPNHSTGRLPSVPRLRLPKPPRSRAQRSPHPPPWQPRPRPCSLTRLIGLSITTTHSSLPLCQRRIIILLGIISALPAAVSTTASILLPDLPWPRRPAQPIPSPHLTTISHARVICQNLPML